MKSPRTKVHHADARIGALVGRYLYAAIEPPQGRL
jgi:hypothetical protein